MVTLSQCLSRAIIGLIKAYRYLLSPWLGTHCRFVPTCSVYGLGAFQQYRFDKAFYLTTRRLLRCHPWHAGGHDPLPQHDTVKE